MRIELQVSARKVLPCQSPHWPAIMKETLELPIYTPALWPVRVCCELLHSRNVLGSKHAVHST